MKGTREIAQRIVNAEEAFYQTIQDLAGCTRDEAIKVLAEYRKAKLARVIPAIGAVHVKHGACYDVDVIRRAIDA